MRGTTPAHRFRPLSTVRVMMLRLRGAHVGRGVRIDRGVRVRSARKLRIGPRCWLKEGVIVDARSDREYGVALAEDVSVRCYAYLDAYGGDGTIIVGPRTMIGQYNYIGGNGTVVLGADVMLSAHCTITSVAHGQDPHSGLPFREQPERLREVRIHDNVWIAANSVVCDGSVIGQGTVVAAGSVVRGAVSPSAFVAGSPARPKR